mmetsp:Transcript_28633/g.96407  ORF Transcript_28633/g.96407 Transcript_28633/m.96407 type:complete len:204 (+) Transcript_28633:2560-3171(+)
MCSCLCRRRDAAPAALARRRGRAASAVCGRGRAVLRVGAGEEGFISGLGRDSGRIFQTARGREADAAVERHLGQARRALPRRPGRLRRLRAPDRLLKRASGRARQPHPRRRARLPHPPPAQTPPPADRDGRLRAGVGRGAHARRCTSRRALESAQPARASRLEAKGFGGDAFVRAVDARGERGREAFGAGMAFPAGGRGVWRL